MNSVRYSLVAVSPFCLFVYFVYIFVYIIFCYLHLRQRSWGDYVFGAVCLCMSVSQQDYGKVISNQFHWNLAL